MIIRELVFCFVPENHSAPPDVTTYTSEHSIQVERPQGSTTSRTAPKYGNAELMETGDGTSSLFFLLVDWFPSPALLGPRLGVFPLDTQSLPESDPAGPLGTSCREGPHHRNAGSLQAGWELFLVGKMTMLWEFSHEEKRKVYKILVFLLTNSVGSAVNKLLCRY